MAERVGFEPTVTAIATTVFETAPFDHSGTSPQILSHRPAVHDRLSVVGRLRLTTACSRPTVHSRPSQVGEKPPQEFSALLSHDARRHFAAMVQPGILHQIAEGAAGACFWIESSEYQARQSGKYDRPGTHGTGFERHVECSSG